MVAFLNGTTDAGASRCARWKTLACGLRVDERHHVAEVLRLRASDCVPPFGVTCRALAIVCMVLSSTEH